MEIQFSLNLLTFETRVQEINVVFINCGSIKDGGG